MSPASPPARIAAALAAACLPFGCSRPSPPVAKKLPAPEPVRITQFYATVPRLPRGEQGLLCYGVENARSVWIEPPRRELSAALARCIEVEPAATTTYTLTAEGEGGKTSRNLTVTVGAAKAKILEVQVSSVEVKRGDPVSICWQARNATVKVAPLVSPQPAMPNCIVDLPDRTRTYVVTATGADGDHDEERVQIKVR